MVFMTRASACIRWTVFSLNCLIWIGGSVMLGLAIWVTTQDTEYKHITGNIAVTAGYIVVSLFIFITGFLGTFGILLLKPTLLKVYFVMVLILVVAELTISIYLYVERSKIKSYIQTNWNKTDDSTRILIQTRLMCCSMKPVITSHHSSNHKSCFSNMDVTKSRLPDCFTKLSNWIHDNYIMLATCAIVVATVEMFVLGGSCRLLAITESGDRMVRQVKVTPAVATMQQNFVNSENATTKRNRRVSGVNTTSSPKRIEEEPEHLILKDEPVKYTERKEWAKTINRYDKK